MVWFCKTQKPFIVYIKTEDIYEDIAGDVEARFDTLIYELEFNSIERLLQKCKHKKEIRLIKCELGGKWWQNLSDKEQKLIVT